MSAYGPFSECPGLGDDEYPGFPADVCPEEMPDFSKHHSLLADVFKKDKSQYEKHRLLRTRLGVGLAKCIKTGADNRGHPMIKTVGLVAGDEYCYETFGDIFDRVVRQRHGDGCLSRPHLTDMDRNKLSCLRADGSGKYVLSTQIRAARGLAGVRFPPALSFQDRREVERVIVRALLEMDGKLKGDYFPLTASRSYAPKPGGMSPEEEEELRTANLVFEQPDSTTTLCSGVGRHWPDARGVFVNSARSFSVWVNEEEHLRAIAVRQGDAIQDAFLEMTEALDKVIQSLRRHADCPDGFAHSSKLGFLTSCPSNIGTALRISVILKLPLLTQQASLNSWCTKRRLTLRSAIDESGAQLCGVVEVSNCDRLGMTEIESVNLVVEAVTELVLAEQRLESGGPGLEAAAEPGATASTAAAKAEEIPKAPLAMSPTPSEQDNVVFDIAGNALGMLFSCEVDGKTAKIDAPEALVSPTKSQAEIDREAAAAKIQAIQRGKHDRQAAQKKKAEVTGAATKIQAIQRGRHERKEVENHKKKCDEAATKIQAIQRGKEARKGKTKESVRPPAATIEDVKSKAKATLEAALDNGNLQAVLQEIKQDAQAAQTDSLEDVRAQMKRLLEESCDSGALSQALAEVKADKKPVRDTESVRQQMKDILVEAESSGTLEAALRNVQGSAAAEAAETEDIRLHVKSLLEEAANSGALTQALTEVKGVSAGKAGEPSVEDVRKKMREMLEECADSGALSQALAQVKGSEPTVEDIRSKMRDLLEEACDTGNLASALAEVKAGATEPNVEDVREKMKNMLEEACDSGALADALACLKDPNNAEDSSLEDIRLQMKDMLEAACDSGALCEALAESKMAKTPSKTNRDTCRDLLAEFTHADEATLGTAGAMPLMLAVSNCDRRIGALNAMITETQRRIQDQEAYALQLEADIATAKQDSAQLAVEYDRQQRILDEADTTHRKLQDKQKKLFDDLDDEALKHRHCILDLDPSMYSARSEMSTVCTVRDLQNTDLSSPFNQVTASAITAPAPTFLS
mmetsp:Transcript_63176/g.119508  ORF Transcript_63176/g.119508 Transcript_63176/m.119508 type:complete len:1033 (+) Transcript_63176:109-3207(+)